MISIRTAPTRLQTRVIVCASLPALALGATRVIVSASLAVLALSVMSCGSTPRGELKQTGDLTVELYLPSQTPLISIRYLVTGDLIDPITDVVAVTGTPATSTVMFAGLLVAKGYTVDVTAVAVDTTLSCRASGHADIAAHRTTNLFLALHCQPPPTGAAVVTAKVVSCPQIQSLSAAPLTTSVGSSIDLSAQAVAADGTTPVYAWTATSGSFSAPNSPTGRFTCAAPGTDTITLTVTVMNGTCSDHQSFTVTCVPVTTLRLPRPVPGSRSETDTLPNRHTATRASAV